VFSKLSRMLGNPIQSGTFSASNFDFLNKICEQENFLTRRKFKENATAPPNTTSLTLTKLYTKIHYRAWRSTSSGFGWSSMASNINVRMRSKQSAWFISRNRVLSDFTIK